MNQARSPKPGLEALYARLDEIHMSPADRLNAKAALAQADAMADVLIAVLELPRRLFGTRARTRYSAT
jgi:hypothetical protein